MTYNEFGVEYAKLCAYFNEPQNDLKAGVYYDALKFLEIAEFQNIVKKVLMTYKYNTLPKIADFLEALHGSADEQAQRALDLALDACITAGGCSVIFQDQKLNRVIKLFGGWNAFGYMSFTGGEVEAQTNRKRFIEYYKSAEPLKISHFIGEYEKSNKMGGVLDKNVSFVYKIANSGKITKVSLNEREKEFELLENKTSAGALNNIKAIANIKKIN